MKRVFVVGGAWSLVLVIGGVCLAADTKRQGPQPASNPPRSAAAPASSSSGGLRYVSPPPNTGGVDTNRRAADARHAAQAAAAQAVAAQAAAAARRAAARPVTPVRPATPSTSVSPNNGFGYGYGRYYPRYSYGFYGGYGYPTTPYGTSPYVLGYDPYSGQSYLYPYNGGYGYGYSPYGYRSPYYIPYLGFGYPGAVFANPGQLFGIGPIQQLMGVGPGFQGQPNFGPFANGAPFANGNANAVNPNGANGNNNANPGFANGNNAGNAAVNNPPPARKAAAVPGSKAMDLAWQFITFGDAHFGNLKYNDALDRYRRAARRVPDAGRCLDARGDGHGGDWLLHAGCQGDSPRT